nr:PREDICTED: venom serine protease Bi-VSP-like [Megachile rotundata]
MLLFIVSTVTDVWFHLLSLQAEDDYSQNVIHMFNIKYFTVRKQDKCSFLNDASCRTHRVKRQFFDRTCLTPENELGDCIDTKQCPLLLATLIIEGESAHDYIRERTCSFDGRNAIVCCFNATKNSESRNHKDPLLRPPHCGLSGGSHDKVVGGVRARLGAWPWIAALGYRNASDPSQLQWKCGGSLISARHVLTAAHCCNNYLSTVRIGDLNLRRFDDGAHPVQVEIAQKIIHPLYRTGVAENDIAVLKLAEDVPFSKTLHPICLPVDPPLRDMNLENYYPYIAGWGSQSLKGETVDHLMEANVPVISNDDCKRQYSNIRGAVIDNRVVCAGFPHGGKDACQGDSGGPLMLSPSNFFY